MTRTLIDLSHQITDGLVTYPGLPTPTIGEHLTRDASRAIYQGQAEFSIGTITMCANTGTYLDTPFHRDPDGHDLAGLALERVVDVPAVCIDVSRGRTGRIGEDGAIDLHRIGELDFGGVAVLIRTGAAAHFGTSKYAGSPQPHLTKASAEALLSGGVGLVGIDCINIDSMADPARPVHTTLLRAGVPIVEHLRGLELLPMAGFRFTAVPPAIVGMGTFCVRAFATVDDDRRVG